MRNLLIVLGLAVVLPACGQSGGPVHASGMRAQLADTPVAVSVNPDSRVGAIFLGQDIWHTCTGSVVHSAGGDLILTAAHCLAKDFPTTFVPGFARTAEPSNMWRVDAVYLDPRWVTGKDPRADYAFARVSRAGGGSVEAQVGSGLTLGMAPKPGTEVEIAAYSAGLGGGPIECRAITGITPSGYPSFRCAGMVDGTSGAPWISGSTVTGVIGGLQGGGCTSYVSYSAPFDERTAALLARAEAGGPGDDAPIAFSIC